MKSVNILYFAFTNHIGIREGFKASYEDRLIFLKFLIYSPITYTPKLVIKKFCGHFV
jgi:hypothetical protein